VKTETTDLKVPRQYALVLLLKVVGRMVKALESEEVSVLVRELLRVCGKGETAVVAEYCLAEIIMTNL
jgi:hypothetical protein